MTRDLIETGRTRGFRVTYQKREAEFTLRAGTVTTYFSAHNRTLPITTPGVVLTICSL